MARLSKLYEWAMRKGYVSCSNPVKGADYPEAKQTLDYLSRDEVIKLLTYAEEKAPDLLSMIATAILLGSGPAYGNNCGMERDA